MTVSDYEQVEAGQLARLRILLDALIPNNQFYTPILRAAGVTPQIQSLVEFQQRMPLTTKQQIIEDHLAHPPYGTNLTCRIKDYSRYSQTSGSTAQPVRWLDTDASWKWMIDIWQTVFDSAGVTSDDRVMFAFSFGPFIGFWLAFEAAVARGCLCLPGGGLSSAARLQIMRDNRVTVLCCTPTYALHLGQQAGADAADVRLIIVAGEPGGSIAAVRRCIEANWPGARVFDHHGMTEVGPVSHEDPDRSGVLRIVTAAFIAEVIDPVTGMPIGPGGIGELVLTNLGRTGSPLLRYRTGDMVRRTDAPEVVLDGGIIGRVDDMITIRGVNVFPSVIDEIVRSCPGVMEYQVHVCTREAMKQMSLLVELKNSSVDRGLVIRTLDTAFRSVLSLRIPVRVVEPGSLPRFELKAKRWVSS